MLTRYGPTGASSRLRAYQYLPYLQTLDLQITALPFFPDSHQQDLYAGRSPRWGRVGAAYLRRLVRLARVTSFDLVWIEHEVFPWLPAFAERLIAGLGIPYVVDYDDAIYHRYELHPRAVVRFLLGKKIDAIMRAATTVIVGNHYLGEHARAAGARSVEYLPTVVDLARYPTAPGRGRTGFTVGWIGSASTVKYLSAIGPALAEFCQATGARLVVVGARDVRISGVQVEAKAWSESTEVDDVNSFDVGIMPLPDDPWERGKCGYKLIQYMACARPVVASPVGINQQIVEHGINGFLATTLADWRTALDTLHSAPDLRRRMGTAGRITVETTYNTQVTGPCLAAILTRAGHRKGLPR